MTRSDKPTTLRRIKLTVAYDGTNYSGFQRQKDAVTVEQVLQETICRVLKEPVELIGASRTDAGVHAKGNVCVFDTRSTIPGDKFPYVLNPELPKDIGIMKSEEVSKEFHPRYRRTLKTYEYRIYNAKVKDPLKRLYAAYCYHDLDPELMRQGAAYLVGRQDFASYCSVKTTKESTVRTVYSIDIEKSQDEILIRVKGDGFLYHMVRLIAGVLMRVGMKNIPPEEVKKILEERTKGFAKPVAPAAGLTLVSIEYPEDRCPWAKSEKSIAYHDKEWGIPVHDDRKLFEMLILEGQQAGLSWDTILMKRGAFREAFADFDYEKVAEYDETKIAELMENPDIIRNRRKLDALVKNARAFIKVREEFGSFDRYIWQFTKGRQILHRFETPEEIPISDELSDVISKDLKKRGFSFVGTVIVYSFMQSIGMVNDHLTSCFRHGEIRDYYEDYD